MPMPSCNCHLPPSSQRSLGGAPMPPTIVLLLTCTRVSKLYCSLTSLGAYVLCRPNEVQDILSNLYNYKNNPQVNKFILKY